MQHVAEAPGGGGLPLPWVVIGMGESREGANGDGLMGVKHKKQQIIVICCFLLLFVAFFIKWVFAKSNRGAVV